MALPEIFEYVKTFGIAGVFAVFWWLERGERIDAQKELRQVAKDAAIAITVMEKTIAQWTSVFSRPAGSNQ